MIASKHSVLTIGHSTHLLETFLALLRHHCITAVADVRSAPYSRFNPQYNREALTLALTSCGIHYVFLGRELGGRSDDRSCYENGRLQYTRLAQTDLFRSGIDRVIRGASDQRIALMCSEKEPLECHRSLLVARALEGHGVGVKHILSDGRLESHSAAMMRLLDVVGLPREELFRSQQELVAEALARQEERVAYVDEKVEAKTTEKKQ